MPSSGESRFEALNVRCLPAAPFLGDTAVGNTCTPCLVHDEEVLEAPDPDPDAEVGVGVPPDDVMTPGPSKCGS